MWPLAVNGADSQFQNHCFFTSLLLIRSPKLESPNPFLLR